MIAPLVSFDMIDLGHSNKLLEKWGHKMGPLDSGNVAGLHYALLHEGRPVAVAMAASLIRECVGGGLQHRTRADTIELARLCAERPGLCRVALRLWREFVFPRMQVAGAPPGTRYTAAISYQDADMHSGNTYRFDGWHRAGFSHSGTDSRSGKKGRNKWVWVWPPAAGIVVAGAPQELEAVEP